MSQTASRRTRPRSMSGSRYATIAPCPAQLPERQAAAGSWLQLQHCTALHMCLTWHILSCSPREDAHVANLSGTFLSPSVLQQCKGRIRCRWLARYRVPMCMGPSPREFGRHRLRGTGRRWRSDTGDRFIQLYKKFSKEARKQATAHMSVSHPSSRRSTDANSLQSTSLINPTIA